MFISHILAVGLSVANPCPRYAAPCAVAEELPCTALAFAAVLALVRLVGAVGLTVALPRDGDALAVLALILVRTANRL